jgi:hypothetical protein
LYIWSSGHLAVSARKPFNDQVSDHMRDAVAAALAFGLLVLAASLATTLRMFRKQRRRAREDERTLGRTIVAEIPAQDDLTLFTEDADQFHYGVRSIDKRQIVGARILINGAVIAACGSARRDAPGAVRTTETIDDRPEGIARDRWDVAIDTLDGTVVVECGAIRERVSQELARAVFDAVREELRRQDAG